MKTKAWKVYYQGRHIDTVFFDADIDAWHVRHSLVNHDGYPSGIEIIPQ